MNWIIICILSIVLILLIISLILSNFELVMSFKENYHKMLYFIKIKCKKDSMILPFINTYFTFYDIYDLYRHTIYDITIITKDNNIIKHCTLYLTSNQILVYKVCCADRINNNDIAYIIFNNKNVNKRIKDNIEDFINVNIP